MVLAFGVGPVRVRRIVRLLTWAEAVVLKRIRAGVYRRRAAREGEDLAGRTRRLPAGSWHAYLWDPWFLVWGVLGLAALIGSRNRGAGRIPMDP